MNIQTKIYIKYKINIYINKTDKSFIKIKPVTIILNFKIKINKNIEINFINKI